MTCPIHVFMCVVAAIFQTRRCCKETSKISNCKWLVNNIRKVLETYCVMVPWWSMHETRSFLLFAIPFDSYKIIGQEKRKQKQQWCESHQCEHESLQLFLNVAFTIMQYMAPSSGFHCWDNQSSSLSPYAHTSSAIANKYHINIKCHCNDQQNIWLYLPYTNNLPTNYVRLFTTMIMHKTHHQVVIWWIIAPHNTVFTNLD